MWVSNLHPGAPINVDLHEFGRYHGKFRITPIRHQCFAHEVHSCIQMYKTAVAVDKVIHGSVLRAVHEVL
jgi:hypothetical protein